MLFSRSEETMGSRRRSTVSRRGAMMMDDIEEEGLERLERGIILIG